MDQEGRMARPRGLGETRRMDRAQEALSCRRRAQRFSRRGGEKLPRPVPAAQIHLAIEIFFFGRIFLAVALRAAYLDKHSLQNEKPRFGCRERRRRQPIGIWSVRASARCGTGRSRYSAWRAGSGAL